MVRITRDPHIDYISIHKPEIVRLRDHAPGSITRQ
jgi:hypothetical protein